MRYLTLITAMLAFLSVSSDSSERRRLYVRVERGVLFWHGHKIHPPYAIEVGFRLDPDTLVVNTYVNGLPLVLPKPNVKKIMPAPQQIDLHARRAELLDRVERASEQAKQRGENSLDAKVREVRGEKELVDSVRTHANGSLEIYWRGSRRPEHVYYTGNPTTTASLPRLPGALARSLAEGLDGGGLILVGADWLYFGERDAKKVVAQIDSLQRGLGGDPPGIRDPHLLRDLRSPKPIPAILREGD